MEEKNNLKLGDYKAVADYLEVFFPAEFLLSKNLKFFKKKNGKYYVSLEDNTCDYELVLEIYTIHAKMLYSCKLKDKTAETGQKVEQFEIVTDYNLKVYFQLIDGVSLTFMKAVENYDLIKGISAKTEDVKTNKLTLKKE